MKSGTRGQTGAPGLQLSLPPASQGASPSPTRLQAVNSLSGNLLKSITDLWSHHHKGAFCSSGDGLNRNELTDGGFPTLSILASLSPFSPFIALLLFSFFYRNPAGPSRDKATWPPGAEVTNTCMKLTWFALQTRTRAALRHGGLLAPNSSYLAKKKIKQNEKPIRLNR